MYFFFAIYFYFFFEKTRSDQEVTQIL